MNAHPLLRRGLVAVLRSEDPAEVLGVADACVRAGLDVLEVTMTVPGAVELVGELRRRHPQACVGAGTCLGRAQAEEMIAAGADFVVSPALRTEVIEAGREAGVPVVPGIATATELFAAHDLGCDLVKLFPAGPLGVGTLSALRAVAPGVAIMPTGGVDETDVEQWWRAGAAAVGLGSSLHAHFRRGGEAALAHALAPLLARDLSD